MKRILLLLLSFLLLLPLTIEADVTILQARKNILLTGSVPSKPTKSVVVYPFTAELIDNEILSIYSNLSISDVTVSIYKDGVIVDQDVFSFAAGDTEFVSLCGYDSGDYVLVLTTGTGIYLEGEFSL